MLLEKVQLPEANHGVWRIERFQTDAVGALIYALKGRGMPVGEEFTRLMRGNTVVMSDTPAEMRDHREPVRRARGSCLLNGLGLGMVLKAILQKTEVTDVTVVEISPEVLELVAPHYPDPRVQFVQCDALAYQPPKGKRYQMVWNDIFDYICSDNLPIMTKLKRKYGRKCDWQGCWAEAECRLAKAEYRRLK